MTREWLTFGEAAEIVRARIGGSVGRSAAGLQAARSSGEVRFSNPAAPILLLADDGLIGLDMRQDAQRKLGITADGKPVTHDVFPNESAAQINTDDLLDWLDRHHPAAKPPGRRGRPSHNWSEIEAATKKLMDHHGDFSPDDQKWNAQARLETVLCDQFAVGISTLRERLPKFLDDWRKAKAGK
jgi:hypothetical protein